MFGGYDKARVARVTKKLTPPRPRPPGAPPQRPNPTPSPRPRQLPTRAQPGTIRGQGYPGRDTPRLGRYVDPVTGKNF